ncbi:MAG: tryptophan-rich sensory protein [Ruminococcaceae bacterium]|nr:tryptophan-rich sensory protein [Oscillospiraceae bacterium]
MTIQWKKLLLCLAIPLAVGGLSALLSGNMEHFETLEKPPLAPPGWLFPVVWTILFLMMGLASYLVAVSDAPPTEKQRALRVYGLQLGFNFLWSILFFRFEEYLFAFIWLVILWVLIAITLLRFVRIRPAAGRLLVPYLAWVTFAGYLNFGIYLLNP